MNAAKLTFFILIAVSLSAFGAFYRVNNGLGSTASGIESGWWTFRDGTSAGTAFTGAVGGVSSGPGVVAIGFFYTDYLTQYPLLGNPLPAFSQFGESSAFLVAGGAGNRSVFSISVSGTVTGSAFSGKNIYLFIGDGTTFANSHTFLVVKTAEIFSDAQDQDPGYRSIAIRPANSTLLYGMLAQNVWTTDADNSITPGWSTGYYLSPPHPWATTGAANPITATSATLNGTVSATGLAPTAQFKYGLTTSYGSTMDATPGSINGPSEQAFSARISGLQLGKTYHYRLSATSPLGTNVGADMTFVTTVPSIAAGELVAPKMEISGGNLNFTVQPSVDGRNYQLQYSDTLMTGTWLNLGSLRVGDGNILTISTPLVPAAMRRFYRLALN
jgi:hypothetical protein